MYFFLSFLGKSKISHFFERKILRNNDLLQLRRKTDKFSENRKRSHVVKTLIFVERAMFSAMKICTEYLETCEKYDLQRNWDPLPVGYLIAVRPHICIMKAVNNSALQHEVCASWAKSGKGKK